LVADIKRGIQMKVFEKRVLKRIVGPKRDEEGENCTMRSFITCILRQV
jgi:hypothetical protein